MRVLAATDARIPTVSSASGHFGDWSYVTRLFSITLAWIVQARLLTLQQSKTVDGVIASERQRTPDTLIALGPGVRFSVDCGRGSM